MLVGNKINALRTPVVAGMIAVGPPARVKRTRSVSSFDPKNVLISYDMIRSKYTGDGNPGVATKRITPFDPVNPKFTPETPPSKPKPRTVIVVEHKGGDTNPIPHAEVYGTVDVHGNPVTLEIGGPQGGNSVTITNAMLPVNGATITVVSTLAGDIDVGFTAENVMHISGITPVDDYDDYKTIMPYKRDMVTGVVIGPMFTRVKNATWLLYGIAKLNGKSPTLACKDPNYTKNITSLQGAFSFSEFESLPMMNFEAVTEGLTAFSDMTHIVAFPPFHFKSIIDASSMFIVESGNPLHIWINPTTNIANNHKQYPSLDIPAYVSSTKSFNNLSFQSAKPTSITSIFQGQSKITGIPNIDFSEVLQGDFAMAECVSIKNLPNLAFKKATSLGSVCLDCTSLVHAVIDIPSTCTNISQLFGNFLGDASGNVTPTKLESVSGVWHIDNLVYMNSAFASNPNLTIIPLSTATMVIPKVINAESVLRYTGITHLGKMKFSKPVNIQSMFDYCSSLECIKGIEVPTGSKIYGWGTTAFDAHPFSNDASLKAPTVAQVDAACTIFDNGGSFKYDNADTNSGCYDAQPYLIRVEAVSTNVLITLKVNSIGDGSGTVTSGEFTTPVKVTATTITLPPMKPGTFAFVEMPPACTKIQVGNAISIMLGETFDNITSMEDFTLDGMKNYLRTITAVKHDVTKNVTTLNNAFKDSVNLYHVDSIDVGKVTTVNSVFENCNKLPVVPTFVFNKALTVTARKAWKNCKALVDFPLMDISMISDLDYAWDGDSGLLTFPDLVLGDKLGSLNGTWRGCSGFTSFPKMVLPHHVTSLINTWKGCSKLKRFHAINTSHIQMFEQTWADDYELVCMQSLDTTGGALGPADTIFDNAHKLCNPSVSDRSALTANGGSKWTSKVAYGNDCCSVAVIPSIYLGDIGVVESYLGDNKIAGMLGDIHILSK